MQRGSITSLIPYHRQISNTCIRSIVTDSGRASFPASGAEKQPFNIAHVRYVQRVQRIVQVQPTDSNTAICVHRTMSGTCCCHMPLPLPANATTTTTTTFGSCLTIHLFCEILKVWTSPEYRTYKLEIMAPVLYRPDFKIVTEPTVLKMICNDFCGC